MSKGSILLEGSFPVQEAIRPQIPTNVGALLDSGGSLASLGLVGAGFQLFENLSGSANASAAEVGRYLKFGRSKVPAGTQLLFNVAALQGADGKVSFALKTRATFQPAYTSDDDWALRSLFQDVVSLRIWPTDPSLVNIDSSGIAPRTDMGEVNYANAVTWTVGGGFEGSASGPTASVNAEYSTQVTASSAAKDFDLRKMTRSDTKQVKWVSGMRNLYSGNVPDTEGYDARNPFSIVVDGAFTKSLRDPPAAATSDFDLEFHAAYRSVSNNITSRKVGFRFETRQRLIYARVVGRTGPRSARTGGTALVIPYLLVLQGGFTMDLATRTLVKDPDRMTGYNCNMPLPPES